jgi:hypothetical protein
VHHYHPSTPVHHSHPSTPGCIMSIAATVHHLYLLLHAGVREAITGYCEWILKSSSSWTNAEPVATIIHLDKSTRSIAVRPLFLHSRFLTCNSSLHLHLLTDLFLHSRFLTCNSSSCNSSLHLHLLTDLFLHTPGFSRATQICTYTF